MQWADNPDVMAQFSLDELAEINKNLADLVCAFVDYDAKITGSQEAKIEKKIKKRGYKASTTWTRHVLRKVTRQLQFTRMLCYCFNRVYSIFNSNNEIQERSKHHESVQVPNRC
jgi:bisphosphoglycerate-dependent phosphoglycerate mutase